MLVRPSANRAGRVWSSVGLQGTEVRPEEYRSFQKRLLGWAYACPEREVWRPGFRPTSMTMRLGPMASGSRGRWEYLVGEVELLGVFLRRLEGEGWEVVIFLTAEED